MDLKNIIARMKSGRPSARASGAQPGVGAPQGDRTDPKIIIARIKARAAEADRGRALGTVAEGLAAEISDLVADAAVLRRLREGSANLGLPDAEGFVARAVGGDPESDPAARSIRSSMANNMAERHPDIPCDGFPAFAGGLLEVAGKLRAAEERLGAAAGEAVQH